MNKAELKDYVSKKLRRKYEKQYRDDPAWAWEQIKESVKNSTPNDKAEIIKRLANAAIIERSIVILSDTEADQMLANDSLDLNELTRILGE